LQLKVNTAMMKIDSLLPQLKGVRDSAHHIEDRGVKRDRKNQPIKGDGHLFVISSLFKSNNSKEKLVYTNEDGYLGEIEISAQVLDPLSDIFQEIVDIFFGTEMRIFEVI